MGEVGHIDWTCEHCQARRFTCCDCGDVVIVDDDPESEMCERCFRDPVRRKRRIETSITIDFDVEEDGRHIAEIPTVPGALAYGSTQLEAAINALKLALAEEVE